MAIASVSISDASGGDGWGDGDDDGGGWDDADGGDWGSLEEPMQPEKVDNDDWVGSFNSGVKSHSAASTMSFNSGVKSHSALGPVTATDSNPSDSWGNDWGETNSNSMNSSDEARKRREEKKAERQKEIEAKRAAKKGPMRLGAKKNLD